MGNISCYAVVMPGLESIAADELHALSAHDVEADSGGVHFTTTIDGLFRINLRSRCSTRVLIRLARFKALSFPELYNKTKRIDWNSYMTHEVDPVVRASCHGSRLLHSGRVEKAVRDAILDGRRRQKADAAKTSVKKCPPRQQIWLRLNHDVCTLSLDSSGDRLDRRGYRLASGKAPLRETMAAAILSWMSWQPGEPLLSPMCGSGTFAIEAALMARQQAAGLAHDFPFFYWPGFRAKRWQRALSKADAMKKVQGCRIIATDADAGMVRQAMANAERAGVADSIQCHIQDVRNMPAPQDGGSPGLIVCNPPYGDRIRGDARRIYKDLGRLFQQQFSGWRMAVIVPDQGCEHALALAVKRRLKVKHGGKWVHVLHVEPKRL